MYRLPLLSIIIPTFNSAGTLIHALESICRQTYRQYEIIVVDNLSSDGTENIVNDFSKRFGKIKWHTQKDNGVYDAMNKGIDWCRGEWVYFMGSDDEFYSKTVLEEVFQSRDLSQYDIIYGNVQWGDTGKIYDHKFTTIKLLEKNICHQAIFTRKSLYDKLGKFDTKYPIVADYVFNFKWFNDENIRRTYIDTIIAKFDPNGISGRNRDEVFFSDRDALIERFFPEEYARTDKELRRLPEQIFKLHNDLRQKDKIIVSKELLLTKMDHDSSVLKETLKRKDEVFIEQERAIQKRDQEIYNLHHSLQKNEEKHKGYDLLISQKDREIYDMHLSLQDNEEKHKGYELLISKKDQEIYDMHHSLQKSEEKHRGYELLISKKDQEIYDMHLSQQKKDINIRESEKRISDKDIEIFRLHKILQNKESIILETEKAIEDKSKEISRLSESLRLKDEQIKDNVAYINIKDQELSILQNTNEELNSILSDQQKLTEAKVIEVRTLISAMSDKDCQIDKYMQEVSDLTSKVREQSGEIERLAFDLSRANHSQNMLDRMIFEMKNSYSWKIGRAITRFAEIPLKGLKSMVGFVSYYFKLSVYFSRFAIRNPKEFTRQLLLFIKNHLIAFFRKNNTHEIQGSGEGVHNPGNSQKQKRIVLSDTLAVHFARETPSCLNLRISVVIPTKNAGDEFHYSLMMLKKQQGIKSVEIIVVDSGSEDHTVEFAISAGAKVIRIKPEEFSHSYARNLGAENATGDFLFFTVQDAVPSSVLFFYELAVAIKSKNVSAVSCAEMSRSDADIFYKAISSNHYRFLGVLNEDKYRELPTEVNYNTMRQNGQLSDIALLIKRDLFLTFKYAGSYAEDLDLGIRLLKEKIPFIFLGTVKIIHSHTRPAYYFIRRGFVDTVYLKDRFHDLPGPPLIDLKSLIQSVLVSYTRIRKILASKILTLSTPFEVDSLNIRDELVHALKENDISIDVESLNPYIDGDFKGFLIRMHDMNSRYQDHFNYDGIILLAFIGFYDLIYSFMCSNYELVNDQIREEYIQSLFKSFALITGSHLAYCYLDNPRDQMLQVIHSELSQNI